MSRRRRRVACTTARHPSRERVTATGQVQGRDRLDGVVVQTARERAEQLRLVGDARAVVFDVTSTMLPRSSAASLIVRSSALRGTSRRCRADCRRSVRAHRGRSVRAAPMRRRDRAPHRRDRVRAGALGDLAEHLAERSDLSVDAEVAALELRKPEHVGHDATKPGRVFAHAARVVLQLPRIAESVGEHVTVELQSGEWRAELVGGGCRELAALARELLGADHEQQDQRGRDAATEPIPTKRTRNVRAIASESPAARASVSRLGSTVSPQPGATAAPANRRDAALQPSHPPSPRAISSASGDRRRTLSNTTGPSR